MPDGFSSIFRRIDPPDTRVPGVWRPPSADIKNSRTWGRISATVISRSQGEGYFRSDQHLTVRPLNNYGQASIQVEGGRVQAVQAASPRTLVFRPAGVGVRTAISAPEYRYAAIFQDPQTYRDLDGEISSPVSLAALEPQPTFEDPKVSLLMDAIIGEIDDGTLDPLLIDALNIALAVQITCHFFGPSTRLLPPARLSRQRLQRVLDYIEAHMGSLSLSNLAAVACLSPFHFSRSFKRSMGVGPLRYVMGRRIERARRLILHSDMSLTDIAAAVGFDSQASFTSRFSRELGVSPGRLRRQRV
jgi:AraC family transcriptional regulator